MAAARTMPEHSQDAMPLYYVNRRQKVTVARNQDGPTDLSRGR
jgi:hypothetical protein